MAHSAGGCPGKGTTGGRAGSIPAVPAITPHNNGLCSAIRKGGVGGLQRDGGICRNSTAGGAPFGQTEGAGSTPAFGTMGDRHNL